MSVSARFLSKDAIKLTTFLKFVIFDQGILIIFYMRYSMQAWNTAVGGILNNKKQIVKINHTYNACKPEIEKAIIKMTANASGIRNISWVLKISTDKVMSTFFKKINKQHKYKLHN